METSLVHKHLQSACFLSIIKRLLSEGSWKAKKHEQDLKVLKEQKQIGPSSICQSTTIQLMSVRIYLVGLKHHR